MKKYFPILNWLPNYEKSYLSGDLFSGLTVAVLLIPQGMAYAMIAGLPPVYGLYAALVPQFIYALFGTSRQLAVGPVAMDSLLVMAGVSTLASSGTEEYIALAILLAFMVGVIQFLSGILKLGFLVNFLSAPVINGFTSAAAVVIGVNQLKHIFGITLTGQKSVMDILIGVIGQFSEWHFLTMVVGLISIVSIIVLKRIHKRIPYALILVALGTFAVYIFKLDVKYIGDVPSGLPAFSIPDFDGFLEMTPMAFTIALIAFMEAVSISKKLQREHKDEYELDNNQEMIALGLSNVVGSLWGSYPVTGGFSRSAVKNESGARTNLSAFVSAALMGLVLLFLTPLFYYLPLAVLGSIILVAVSGLIDFRTPVFLWKNSKQDFIMLVATFGITLFFGIKEGIAIGVALSLLALVYRTSKPHIAELGKLPGSEEYRNVNRFTDLEIRQDVLVLRQDAQLYFANSNQFSEVLLDKVNKKGANIKLVILHFGSVSSVDTTALQMLRDTIENLNKNSIGVYFTDVIGPVRDFFEKTGFTKQVGELHFFTDVDSAVKYLDGDAVFRSRQMLTQALQSNVFNEG